MGSQTLSLYFKLVFKLQVSRFSLVFRIRDQVCLLAATRLGIPLRPRLIADPSCSNMDFISAVHKWTDARFHSSGCVHAIGAMFVSEGHCQRPLFDLFLVALLLCLWFVTQTYRPTTGNTVNQQSCSFFILGTNNPCNTRCSALGVLASACWEFQVDAAVTFIALH